MAGRRDETARTKEHKVAGNFIMALECLGKKIKYDQINLSKILICKKSDSFCL